MHRIKWRICETITLNVGVLQAHDMMVSVKVNVCGNPFHADSPVITYPFT
jgi:hypothetical protein